MGMDAASGLQNKPIFFDDEEPNAPANSTYVAPCENFYPVEKCERRGYTSKDKSGRKGALVDERLLRLKRQEAGETLNPEDYLCKWIVVGGTSGSNAGSKSECM